MMKDLYAAYEAARAANIAERERLERLIERHKATLEKLENNCPGWFNVCQRLADTISGELDMDHEMKAALSEAYAAQEQRKQQGQENTVAITATVDGVAREVVLTPMQIYTAHRALQDAYDLEDVENILEERVYQDMKPEVLDYLLSHKTEIAAGYRDRLDDDEHWYNVLESVVTDYILASNKK